MSISRSGKITGRVIKRAPVLPTFFFNLANKVFANLIKDIRKSSRTATVSILLVFKKPTSGSGFINPEGKGRITDQIFPIRLAQNSIKVFVFINIQIAFFKIAKSKTSQIFAWLKHYGIIKTKLIRVSNDIAAVDVFINPIHPRLKVITKIFAAT